jgi:squalene-hopene/tetraprenyl-beta-curcumene cyclase
MAKTPSTVEETALALESLAAAWEAGLGKEDLLGMTENDFRSALQKGFDWLLQETQGGTTFPPAPIGFYFAKLWYYEKLYPVVFTLAALGRSARLADWLWETTPEKVLTR